MAVRLPEEIIERAICKAFELGSKNKAVELGEEPKFISQRQAYKIYGEGNVDRWVRRGVVKRFKDSTKSNARVRYSVLELERAAYTINVLSNLSPMSNAEMVEIINNQLK